MAVALLASLEDFAAERNVTFDPTDVAAISALEQASDVIRGLTDQDFDGIVVDDEVICNGTGTRSLLLPQLPVLAVTEVSIEYHWGEDPIVLTVDTDYRVDLKAGIMWRSPYSVWPIGPQNILVTYTHGYSLPGSDPVTLPADVQGLCKRIALSLMSNAESGGSTVRREDIGTYSIQYDTSSATSEMTLEDYAILNRYRRHQVV